MEKFTLSLAIINYLKACSLQPRLGIYFKNKGKVFKQILINEEYHSSEQVKVLPVDIENTFLGREINYLLEAIAGVESVQPYSDVSFRVISKIADVLTTDITCQAFNIGRNTDDPTRDLLRFYKELYR